MERSFAAIAVSIILVNIISVYGDLPVVCPQCDPNWTPFPNMISGLVGYNIVRGK